MRYSDLRFLLALLLPALTILNMLTRPELAGIWTLAVWWGFALVDAVVPGATTSPVPVSENASLDYFSWVLRLYVPLQLTMIAVGVWAAMHADWLSALGLAFSVGFVSGSQGITFAHELGHSKNRVDRCLAWVLMTSVCYGHFMVEHYRGHHPRAATHDDPASARYGESVYRFLPRTLWGSWTSAWRLEAQRVAQMRQSWLRSPLVWSSIVSFGIIFMAFWLVISTEYAQPAIKIIAFLLLQSFVALLLLELVNYIEHYGLQRTQLDGKREAFGMMHAWNADHVATNSLLANLQRHSDHHMHAWKPYATLQALPGPQLPTGYAGCILLALMPPLWFRLMHPRLAALQQNMPLRSG